MNLSRRRFLRASATGVLAAAGTRALAQGESGQRYNVLWIMTDQQPVTTLSCYGNPLSPTPALDRLAAGGIRFDNFYIAGFPCSPSRASMFSGRYPCSHGVVTNDIYWSKDVPALGDVLSEAGYDMGYVGKWHLAGNMYRGLSKGEEKPEDWMYKLVQADDGYKMEKVPGGTGEDEPVHGFTKLWVGGWKQYHAYLRRVGLGDLLDKNPRVGNHNDLPSGPEGTHMYSRLPQEHHMAAFFAEEACKFLRSRQYSDRPFGLVLSFYGPHLPVAPPKPWDEIFGLDQVALPANHFDDLTGKPLGQWRNSRCYVLPRWTDEQFKDYIRRYYGYCAYLDYQTNKVLSALSESGHTDDTIVLFTSDHGDMVGGHGFIWKLGTCGYEELMRVPFIMRVPGVTKEDAKADALTSNVDILPTILELTGIDPPEGVQGRSFRALLEEPSASLQDAVFTSSMERSFMCRTERHKYVLNWRRRDIDELYDLENDPGEMKNLVDDPAREGVAKEMRERIFEWLRETGNPYAKLIEEVAAKPVQIVLVDVWPEVKEFKYLGGNEFEMTILWNADGPIPGEDKYWSFTQFCNKRYGKDADIVFRFTPWPEPPTTEWKKGERYVVGPIKVTIPDYAGTGKYEIRTGLWNPNKKKGPGVLSKGVGNYRVVGQLQITKAEGKITDVTFTAAK